MYYCHMDNISIIYYERLGAWDAVVMRMAVDSWQDLVH